MSTLTPAATSTDSLITVKAALRLPALRVGAPEVIAGRRNLDRPIRWVHVSEVPNIASLLKGGELLLSTGTGIGRTAASQRHYIDELVERDVAALVIELGQHFQTIPGPLLAEAEEHGLPLISLHREIAFIEVTEAVHSGIVSRQYAALRRGEQIHRRFTELMIEGAGIPEILGALAETIANPVVLERSGRRMLYQATHRAPAADVIAAWEGESGEPQGAGDPAVVDAPVPATGGTTWGRLVALGLDSPLDEFARVAVERAAELVALALLRGHQEEVLAARERGNFLTELAAGRLHPADAAHRAETLGFRQRPGSLLMPLAVFGAARPATGTSDGLGLTSAWESLVTEMRSRKIPVLVGTAAAGEEAHILLGLSSLSRRRELIEIAARAIRSAVERHGDAAGDTAIAGGRAVSSWSELPNALREAVDTAALAREGPPRDWHDAASPDVDRLLWRLQSNADMRAFVDQRLAPLIEHDRRRSAKLLPTLEALLEHEGRKAQTARTLHLERQSLYHRIQRIEVLLGADLRDASVRLGLHLALRARRHLRRGG
jgi:purine catabolism regulator